MEIMFITDYVCPYCLVAKTALEEALRRTGMEANITMQPFELTPEPKERVDTYHDARRRAGYQVLVEPCKKLNLPMHLPPKVVPRPYTRLAFEGWYFAQEQKLGDAYSDRVYRAYFLEEQDIGDIAVLEKIAVGLGMDGATFRSALEAGTYREEEQAAVRYAREVLKPTGVPTIYIDGKKVQLSDYTVSECISILNDASFSGPGGFACGPDGC